MNRCIEISVFVLLVCVIGCLGWLGGFESGFKNQSSKAALTKMHESLRLGDPQHRVVELYGQFRTDRTRFRRHDKKTWEIGMPFELGSGDWILYLEFDDSKKLSAAAFRTSDGIFQRPPNSPEDKGEFTLAMKFLHGERQMIEGYPADPTGYSQPWYRVQSVAGQSGKSAPHKRLPRQRLEWHPPGRFTSEPWTS